MPVELPLDLFRGDVHAAAPDGVADAPHEMQLACRVDIALVAGVKPEVPEGPHGRRQVADVAEHHAVRLAGTQGDLAGSARRQRPVKRIDDAHLDLGHRDARRAAALVLVADPVRDGADFADGKGMQQPGAEALLEFPVRPGGPQQPAGVATVRVAGRLLEQQSQQGVQDMAERRP